MDYLWQDRTGGETLLGPVRRRILPPRSAPPSPSLCRLCRRDGHVMQCTLLRLPSNPAI